MTIQLDASKWQAYFDQFSKDPPTELVEIEVASLGLGDQIVADWVPLKSISYDPKDHILVVRTEAIDHMIQSPSEIHIEEDPEGIQYIVVMGPQGEKQIIKFKHVLKLPREA